MAAKTFRIKCADGVTREFRREKKQGAPNKSPELLRTRRVTIHLTQADHGRFLDAAKDYGMSASTFGELALGVGINKLSVTDKS